MSQIINFPNLGIHLENVGRQISVFGFDITYFGLSIGVAILIGMFITMWQADRTGQDIEEYLMLFIYLIVFGVLGARIYYVIFGISEFHGNYLGILNPLAGGYAFQGALIAGVITVTVYCRNGRLLTWKVLDTFVPALLIGQILGRMGNFFNREAFGGYTDGLFAMQLPVDAVRAADVTEKMRQHMERIDGIDMIQVHPTFLYEIIWCLVILAVVLIYQRFEVYKGEVFLIYVTGYGIGCFAIEMLRTDSLVIPLIHVSIAQIIAVLSVMASVWLLYVNYKSRSQEI